jgi:hypothetical protein
MIERAELFRGQEKLRALLGRYQARGKLRGTLLLLGQRGLGKTTLATVIARTLCCERNQPPPADPLFGMQAAPDHAAPAGLGFCGECYACRSIASGNQPEFVVIRPKGQDIRAEQLDDELDGLRTASLHPVNLPYRIFLFDDAHCLNETTANQLLKLLEEPPARTVFMLVTDQPDKLLPTIRSRGVPFMLSPLPRWQLEELLREDWPTADAEATRIAAYLAGGRYIDAVGLAADSGWRDSICSLANALAHQRDVPERAAAAQDAEFAALWAKELFDSGLSDDEAAKQIEKPRQNELKRQALALAYDRAAWWMLHEACRGLDLYAGTDRRRPAPSLPRSSFLHALTLLKQRIHSNVDPQLAQYAFEGSL